MSEWIEWEGGPRPTKEGTIVEVKYPNGYTLKGDAWAFNWYRPLAYRIIKEPTIGS